ncbi:UbiD family decarboxylase, partial [Chloroflexota bacterium]
LEVAGIQKRLEGSKAVLFNNVKGYPGKRVVTNVFASDARLAKVFGCDETKDAKFRLRDAIRNPIANKVVSDAPCQEVVVTENIDVWPVVPMISHTPSDPGRTLGGGNTLISGKYFRGGSHIGYNRMNFRGKDYSTFQITPWSHVEQGVSQFYGKEPVPMTINMGVPPACTILAGACLYPVIPIGTDELAIAGALQGFPVELVKARTVDAYAIANAEYVIEGYIDTTQRVWESPIAEKDGKQGVHPFHPEWTGYMGKAYRTYKFQATAITHRKDNPIYYPTIVHAYDDHNLSTLLMQACILEFCERLYPGLVVDCNLPLGIADFGGIILQIRKTRPWDEGAQKNLLTAILASAGGMRLAIAVDEDINIYSIEDVLWSIVTRVEPQQDILIVSPGGRGVTFQPGQRAAAATAGVALTAGFIGFGGAIALDATVPRAHRDSYERSKYPIEGIDLKKWFQPEEIAKALAQQNEYSRYLAETGR